jgi:D-tyrosyl-tRNA(Tyr) deacylase
VKIVLQRVKAAEVRVENKIVGSIAHGYLLLVGISSKDDDDILAKAVKKVVNLRLFEDSVGKINLDLKSVSGEILAVPQFTLYADCKKGNRPSFTDAAQPQFAKLMFDKFVQLIRNEGINIATGAFGEKMQVELINIGPVTIILEF